MAAAFCMREQAPVPVCEEVNTAHRRVAAAQVLRRLPPFRTLPTSSRSKFRRHEHLLCVGTNV